MPAYRQPPYVKGLNTDKPHGIVKTRVATSGKPNVGCPTKNQTDGIGNRVVSDSRTFQVSQRI